MSDEDAERMHLQGMVDGEVIPHEEGRPVFNAPWQARLFGIAVALSDREGRIEWSEFQSRLVDEIARDTRPIGGDRSGEAVESIYYERWLRALEGLAIGNGWVEKEEVEKRAREFAAGDRTAAEFVDGEHERASDETNVHIHR